MRSSRRRQHLALGRWVLRSVVSVAALMTVACDHGDQPAVLEAETGLVVVPEPDLTGLDNDTRALVENRRKIVDDISPTDDAGTRAEGYGELGRQYFALELRDAALACFENAALLEPVEFRWRYYLGTLLQERGELDRAAEELRLASDLEPDDLPTRLHLGRVEFDRGRPALARRIFEQVLADDSTVADAHYHVGLIALGESQTTAAIASLAAAVRLDPQATAAHHSLGTAYRRAGDLDRARHHLEQGGGQRPSFADPLLDSFGELVTGARVHLQQGGAARHAGDLDLAVAHYRKATELDPRSAIAAYNLGATLGTMELHTEALAHLDHAVELDPRHRDAHFDRASALTRLGRHDEAASALKRVLEIDPADRLARYRLALVLNALGQSERARNELMTLVEDDPDDLEARLRLARLLHEDGRGGDAEAHYTEALKHDPTNSEALSGLARVFLSRQRYAEASRLLETGLESGSADAALVLRLARLLATCPEPTVRDGARALQLAQALFARHKTLEHAATVAMAFAELGRFDQAVEWQASLVQQAEAGELAADRLASLRAHLASYERGQPVRLAGGV